MSKESLGTVIKRRVQGVVFLFIVAGLIGLSIAIYNKAFTDTVDVTLKSDYTGNQLQEASDVKEDGLIVGSVDSVTSNGKYAIVKLTLDPDLVKQIPSNVTAQILPKTLFGEQYVELNRPQNAARPIRQGDVIGQNHSQGALEAQTVLGNLLPLLTAVQPAELNSTLNALATALQGRGNKLGETLVTFDKYLKILNSTSSTGNTYTAQLADDLGKLGNVALEYNGVAPDLFDSLQNLLTSARTTIEKHTQLTRLLTVGSSSAGILQSFLAENQQRIITVSGQTQQIYGLLNQYSPEYSCLFAGINQLYDKAGTAIYNGAIHLSATPDPQNLGSYKPGEEPHYIHGYGANCFGLPNNPTPTDARGRFQIPEKYQCVNDGAALTPRGQSKNCKSATTTSTSSANDSALNSPAENAMINSVIAGQLHTTPNKVPDAATMLAGPLLRGQNVVLK